MATTTKRSKVARMTPEQEAQYRINELGASDALRYTRMFMNACTNSGKHGDDALRSERPILAAMNALLS